MPLGSAYFDSPFVSQQWLHAMHESSAVALPNNWKQKYFSQPLGSPEPLGSLGPIHPYQPPTQNTWPLGTCTSVDKCVSHCIKCNNIVYHHTGEYLKELRKEKDALKASEVKLRQRIKRLKLKLKFQPNGKKAEEALARLEWNAKKRKKFWRRSV